jgi:2-keto-4-pentenoate hydratase/2-oxohepta-3-ene-1,7-dioic acid hydratase in catechol pathway
MKIARFDSGRIGVVLGDQIADVTALVPGPVASWPPMDTVRLIEKYSGNLASIADATESAPRLPLRDVELNCPVEWPNKLIAFPANYYDHIAEMQSPYNAKTRGFFLKAASSLTGPTGPIVVPDMPWAKIHHESELAIIIGKGGRNITRDDAFDHIFGYSCLLDITVRGDQERVMRKSFDTFTPLGPWIVTADELENPGQLDLVLTVNGEVRQQANTRDLILDIPGMIEMASSVTTLYPGDVFATGTPAGVGPIAPGDIVMISIEGIGEMTVPVVAGGHVRNIAFSASSREGDSDAASNTSGTQA